MSNTGAVQGPGDEATGAVLELGGLVFDVSFRDVGATLRISGKWDGRPTEMLRFDDFVENPHFHAPASGPAIPFDQSLGEPLAWYIVQIRNHLAEWLERAGFEEVVPHVDFDEVSKNADKIAKAMVDCVPAGYVRVPGSGLQRTEVTA